MRLINHNILRKLPEGFLSFLLLVVIFEGVLFFIPEYVFLSVPYGHEAMRIKGEEAERENSYDIIISGDCTGWAGIRPVVLEDCLGESAYNFSVDVAQTYLINYILLKRYLETSLKKPDLVIFQLSSLSLLGSHPIDINTLRDSIFPYFRIDSDLLTEIKMLELDPPFHYLPYRILSLLPSFKKQYALRRGIMEVYLKLSHFERKVYEVCMKSYREEKGFFNEDMNPIKVIIENITEIPPEYKRFTLSSYNCYYIDKILSLLHEENIPTVVCLSPVRSDELEIWSRYKIRERLNNLLRPKMAKYENILAFWDMIDIASDPGYFADRVHLSLAGANEFTEELAKRIKELRAGE